MARALLTNDDGFEAPGFRSLIAAVEILGFEPVLAVPCRPMSGSSRSRKSNTRYEWSELTIGSARGFKIDTTPAGCIVFAATAGIVGPIDLCISGVNAGENLGAELTVSGTFGAVLEAYSYGIRGISISRQYGGAMGSDPAEWDWSRVAGAAAEAIEWSIAQPEWRLANINLPNAPRASPPVRTSVSAQSYFVNEYRLDTHQIHSRIAPDRSTLSESDDIYAFETLSHTSVSLINQPML